jgi:hypothetical protein
MTIDSYGPDDHQKKRMKATEYRTVQQYLQKIFALTTHNFQNVKTPNFTTLPSCNTCIYQ